MSGDKGKDTEKLTPVMRQYHAAKQAHPDCILFFRMGDFYEMFYDDAVVAARELDLTLTSRNKGAPDEVPMAGVPHHAAHGYIARLVSTGFKVAICEQMADPSKTKGIVPREVVRVITPGLVTHEDQLEARSNNYLCALDASDSRFGLALLDVSTGEMLATTLEDTAAIMAELARVEPREVLLEQGHDDLRTALTQILPTTSFREDPPLEQNNVPSILEQALAGEAAAEASDSLSCAALRACARALRMALGCNPGQSLPVQRIVAFDSSGVVQIDEVAQTHLELVRSIDGSKRATLLSVVDETVTAPGARLLRKWILSPLLDMRALRRRQDAVEAFVQDPVARTELRTIFKNIGDIERLAVRATLREITPRDLGVLRDSLIAVPQAFHIVSQMTDPSVHENLLKDGMDPTLLELRDLLLSALVERPPPTVRDGDIFREGFDEELDETGKLQREGADMIIALEADLRASTAIPTLKVRYTRVFGWYIEVSKTHASKVPHGWRRKQTVATGERYTNDALDDLADRLLHAEERHSQRESLLFSELVQHIAERASALRAVGHQIATWDAFASFAEIAHRFDYCRPIVEESDTIDIRDGRHPVVERLAAAGRFVPNDVCLQGDKQRLWLITGPNMAGKSTLMRQVALIVLLAQTGSFVPASQARIGMVDRILSRVGANDNVSRGESTFMVEMRETASILRQATCRSLVILDEIGRGTSTYDGLAIAWAVAEHLHDVIRCRAMFATHYHELTELAETSPHAVNVSVSARERGDDVFFLYKLVPGAASRSYGIAVARLAGVGESVLARAKAILSSLESGGALPGGRYATLRGRSASGSVQLDLFSPQPPQPEPSNPAVETLKQVDPNRLSPLDALQLVIKLKEMIG
ncbi:MAG TPA: DNA mismatch repair protein MutS [Polyangiaceae bacterium]|jgi:DNA mismatch repair protein MutS|nr:MAG: DNA mismatch repair protein MutS [Deltaproteobacteria bacterium ADurb.Bin207]HNS97064.1 DNA mismatch repair protein MutS [Polyangiaceae bacterium]HNZ23440.1 DNA mismatch repair protein MutS [Polyangiaceae bacterium]HOD23730.1 DNA mismatch repair protein MutS [Polyangiaceae bacterium]HOE49976.1 DNA mismatch repair protein MutS [Polyangiaceae bacterium]